MSLQVKYDLLSHIARSANASPVIPLDQVLSQVDGGLADFARDNGLAFFTFELAEGGTPKPARHLHIVRETGAEVGISESKKTVFISKNDAEILKMKAALDEESSYVIEGMVQGQHIKIDLTEEAQKFLVDLVFPIEDRHLDRVLRTRLPEMIVLVLQRYMKGSENGRKYLNLLMKALVLAYLDPAYSESQFNRIGRRLGLIKELSSAMGKESRIDLLSVINQAELKEAISRAKPESKLGLSQIFNYPEVVACLGISGPDGGDPFRTVFRD
jgi:hypothetical protein